MSTAHLARILTDTARVEDTVCRASQNEFAVLLANACVEGALAYAERVRNNIARELVPTGEGSRFYRSAAGVAEWTDAVDSLATLLRLADLDMQKLRGEIIRASGEYLPTDLSGRAARND